MTAVSRTPRAPRPQWMGLLLLVALGACGPDVDCADPIGPPAGVDLWASLSVDSDGLFSTFSALGGNVGGSLVSCETVDGCVVEPLRAKICARRGSFFVDFRDIRVKGAWGSVPLRPAWPWTLGPGVGADEEVTFAHAGSPTIPPFDVVVTMPRAVDWVLGACSDPRARGCTLDPARPVELATAAALGDTALSFVVYGTTASPHVECWWREGQGVGRIPPSVLARLPRGTPLSASVSLTRVTRAPVAAHWVEARASRRWAFDLTLAP